MRLRRGEPVTALPMIMFAEHATRLDRIVLFAPRIGGDQDHSGPERISASSISGSEPVHVATRSQGRRHRGRDGNDELAPSQREPAIPGITCSSGSGLIEICPVKGRSCASISKVDAATPVAKIPSAIGEASRLSLWTIAIATSAQTACMNRHTHLSILTSDSLMMMRCRRASNAVSNAVAMSRCAVF